MAARKAAAKNSGKTRRNSRQSAKLKSSLSDVQEQLAHAREELVNARKAYESLPIRQPRALGKRKQAREADILAASPKTKENYNPVIAPIAAPIYKALPEKFRITPQPERVKPMPSLNQPPYAPPKSQDTFRRTLPLERRIKPYKPNGPLLTQREYNKRQIIDFAQSVARITAVGAALTSIVLLGEYGFSKLAELKKRSCIPAHTVIPVHTVIINGIPHYHLSAEEYRAKYGDPSPRKNLNLAAAR